MQDHLPPRPLFIRCITLGMSLALLPLSGMAGSEIYPGAFTAADPGIQALGVYFYKRKLAGFYIDGQRLGDGELHAHATALAYSNFGQTAGMPSSWNIAIPDIHVHKTSGTLPAVFGDATKGLGDVRVGYSIWPINDKVRGRSLAIAGTLQIPSADYQHTQMLNTGGNRWQATLQLGWIQKLSPTLSFDFVPEVSFYSRNRNYLGYVMKQRPSYAITTYLRWRFLPMWESYAGFQADRGGKQNIAGYELNNEGAQQRVFLGISTALSRNIYTGLRYSRDTSINYELKTTSDLVLHLHYVF